MEREKKLKKDLEKLLNDYETKIEESFINNESIDIRITLEKEIDELLNSLKKDSLNYKKYNLKYLKTKVAYLYSNNEVEKAKNFEQFIFDEEKESYFNDEDSKEVNINYDEYVEINLENIRSNALSSLNLLYEEGLFKSKEEFLSFENKLKEFSSEHNHIIKDIDKFFLLKQLYNYLNKLIQDKLITLMEETQVIEKSEESKNNKINLLNRLEKAETLLSVLIDLIEKCMKNYYNVIISYATFNRNDLKNILYKNVLDKDKSDIEKRFKMLKLLFHPDKTGLPKEKSTDFYLLIEKFTQSLKKNDDMGMSEEYEKIGHEHYKTAIELQNYLKNRNRTDFQYILKEEIENYEDDKIQILLHSSALLACKYYKSACKKADNLHLLEKKLELRKNITLCLYLADKLLESQLASISIYFLIDNVSGFRKEQEDKAKEFISVMHNKIKNKLNKNFKEENDDKSNKDNKCSSRINGNNLEIVNSINTVCLPNTELSSREKKNQKQKAQEIFTKSLVVLINRQALSLNKQKETIDELKKIHIKQTKWKIAKVGGVGLGFGLVGFGSIFTEASVFTEASISAAALGGGAIFSIITSGFVAGYFIWSGYKTVTKLKEKYDCCAKLNEILNESLEFYKKEEFMKFLKKLAEPYSENDSTKKIINIVYEKDKPLDFEISGQDIISKLLELDATPDCIASLLSIIATALISENIKIIQMPYQKIQAKADDIFKAITRSEALDKRAKELDERITKWFVKKLKGNSKSSDSNQNIENKSYRTKLNELKLAAKINLTILSLTMDYGTEGVEAAKSHMLEIHNDIKECQYKLGEEILLRLELLEDFFWIITGEQLNIIMYEIKYQEPDFSEENDEEDPFLISKSHADTYFDSKIKNSNNLEEMLKYIKKKGKHLIKIANQKNRFDSDRFVEYKKALNVFKGYYELRKTDVFVYYEILNCYLELNRFREGIEFIKKMLKSNFFEKYEFYKSYKLWLYMAKIYRKENQILDAKNSIAESIKIKASKEGKEEEIIINNLIKKSTMNKLDFYKTSELNLAPRRNTSKKVYNIVSIDGGGVRGIIPSMLLCEIERRAHLPLYNMVDLFAGTSTGSLIAAGLVLPKSRTDISAPRFLAYDLLELYCTQTKKIFVDNKRKSIFDYCKYDDIGRMEFFKQVTGDFKIADSSIDLLITAVKESRYELQQFTKYDALRSIDKNISIYDAIMASTSAPTFFRPHSFNNCSYLDGGIIANNPAQLAYKYAINNNQIDSRNINILSLGTGDFFSLDKNKSKSLLFWAKEMPVIAIDGQTRETDRAMRELIDQRYHRWQMYLDSPIALDDFNSINKLMDIGEQFIEENDDSINKIVKLFKNI